MKYVAALALLVSAASAFHISGQEDLIKKFGRHNIKFDQTARYVVTCLCHVWC